MQLGKQTGSVTNHILSRATVGQPDPAVGMGATILCWTDRHAATITRVYEVRCRVGKEVHSLLHVEVKQDIATRTDKNGFSENQDWDYQPNPKAATEYFRLQEGRWRQLEQSEKKGRALKLIKGGHGLRIGEREEYYDPCF